MKKVFLLALLFAFFSKIQAQEVILGLKASPGLAWIKSDTKGIVSDGSRLGLAYGAIFDLMFTENYGLGSGLFIQHQGGKLEAEESTDTSLIINHLSYRLQYLNIPISLKMRTNEIGYFRYYGQFGLTPGINLSAKGTSEFLGTETDIEDAKDFIRTFNLGLIVGIGTLYNFAGNTSLLLGLEWNNGFTDIFKDSGASAKNNFMVLNVGVIF